MHEPQIKRICRILACLLFAIIFAGCSSEDKKENRGERVYRKLKNYTLDLSIISTKGEYRRSEANQVFLLVFGLHSMARCENQLSGAAPCQCSVSGGISTTSPGSSLRAALPRS